MPFLKNLFAKKEGGTLVGNTIRGFVNSASGGLFGTGKNMLPPSNGTYTQTQQMGADVGKKVGDVFAPVVAAKTSQLLETPTGQTVTNALVSSTIKNYLKKNWWLFLFPVSYLLYWVVKKASSKK